MRTFLKVAAVVYMAVVLVLVFTLPLGAILCIVAACGGGLSWLGACIPFIVALSVLPFGAVAKYIVDFSAKEAKHEHRNDHAKR